MREDTNLMGNKTVEVIRDGRRRRVNLTGDQRRIALRMNLSEEQMAHGLLDIEEAERR